MFYTYFLAQLSLTRNPEKLSGSNFVSIVEYLVGDGGVSQKLEINPIIAGGKSFIKKPTVHKVVEFPKVRVRFSIEPSSNFICSISISRKLSGPF